MSPEIRQKYDIYRNRTFSASFHRFTIDLCLNFDPFERYLIRINYLVNSKLYIF